MIMNKILIFTLLSVIGLVSLFLAGVYDRFPGDLQSTTFLQGIESIALNSYMKIVSFLTEGEFMFAFGLLVVLIMHFLRKRKEFFMSLGMLIVLHLNPILKLIAGRPRPTTELVEIFTDSKGMSFPSGHAFQVIVLFGFLIYLVERMVSTIWMRRTIQILLIMLILSVGISRIYLGAHWLSDVIAGYYFGFIFLLALIIFWDEIEALRYRSL